MPHRLKFFYFFLLLTLPGITAAQDDTFALPDTFYYHPPRISYRVSLDTLKGEIVETHDSTGVHLFYSSDWKPSNKIYGYNLLVPDAEAYLLIPLEESHFHFEFLDEFIGEDAIKLDPSGRMAAVKYHYQAGGGGASPWREINQGIKIYDVKRRMWLLDFQLIYHYDASWYYEKYEDTSIPDLELVIDQGSEHTCWSFEAEFSNGSMTVWNTPHADNETDGAASDNIREGPGVDYYWTPSGMVMK